MPQLNTTQQQTRLAPQGVTPGNYYSQTGVKQPTSASVSSVVPTPTTNPFAAVGTWLTSVWNGFTNIFNTLGTLGGWFSNPVRILKMVAGIGLVLVGLILLIAEPEIKALPGQAKTAIKTAIMAG